jgi:hypothetical protein
VIAADGQAADTVGSPFTARAPASKRTRTIAPISAT